MNLKILILGVLILLISCKTISTKSESQKNDDSKNLYAFIGEKVSIIEFDPNENNTQIMVDSISGETVRRMSYVMDYGFECKYVVKTNLYNEVDVPNDTIVFKTYDHYGRPEFESYNEVILYLSKDSKGNFFHRKYQYEPIFLNSKKRYYSYPRFLGDGYLEAANKFTSFEIDFPKAEKFDISNISESGIKLYYPNYYYRIEEKYAYPTRGMFLNELVEYRLRTTFKDL